eukprot:SAG31_NODE_164_length_21790_cov_26.291411_9_plen_479_part_00
MGNGESHPSLACGDDSNDAAQEHPALHSLAHRVAYSSADITIRGLSRPPMSNYSSEAEPLMPLSPVREKLARTPPRSSGAIRSSIAMLDDPKSPAVPSGVVTTSQKSQALSNYTPPRSYAGKATTPKRTHIPVPKTVDARMKTMDPDAVHKTPRDKGQTVRGATAQFAQDQRSRSAQIKISPRHRPRTPPRSAADDHMVASPSTPPRTSKIPVQSSPGPLQMEVSSAAGSFSEVSVAGTADMSSKTMIQSGQQVWYSVPTGGKLMALVVESPAQDDDQIVLVRTMHDGRERRVAPWTLAQIVQTEERPSRMPSKNGGEIASANKAALLIQRVWRGRIGRRRFLCASKELRKCAHFYLREELRDEIEVGISTIDSHNVHAENSKRSSPASRRLKGDISGRSACCSSNYKRKEPRFTVARSMNSTSVRFVEGPADKANMHLHLQLGEMGTKFLEQYLATDDGGNKVLFQNFVCNTGCRMC